jgi:hypothetical protein
MASMLGGGCASNLEPWKGNEMRKSKLAASQKAQS